MKTKMIFCTILALFVFDLAAGAQPAKPYRIGVLLPGGALHEAVGGLKDGLKEMGLEEGKHVSLTVVDTKGDAKEAEAAARSFEREKVNLIYTLSTSVTNAARAATTSVPIIFCVGSDPVSGKIVQSFAKPGGRLTGVHFLIRDLTAKRLEILKEVMPKANRILTFYDPANSVPIESAKLGREEAKRLGLKLIEKHVASPEELRKTLQGLKSGEADAYFYIPDAMLVSHAQTIIDTAKAKKIATMFHEQSLVVKGALASYGQNYYEIGRLSAKYVQRVLNGSDPKDLKIDTVENVELAINLKTAKELGLTIPPQVLARASKVIR